MDATVIAKKQETDGLAEQAQGDFRSLAFSAGRTGNREDQSDSTRVGAVLRGGALESVLLICPKLGRKEDTTPSGSGVSAPRFWLEAMGSGRQGRESSEVKVLVPSIT